VWFSVNITLSESDMRIVFELAEQIIPVGWTSRAFLNVETFALIISGDTCIFINDLIYPFNE